MFAFMVASALATTPPPISVSYTVDVDLHISEIMVRRNDASNRATE